MHLRCPERIAIAIGTGKSVLLREIIRAVKEMENKIGITASTGIAAVNIGGTTLHSWAGIGLGDQKVASYSGKFLHQPRYREVLDRWRNTDTLVIDESRSQHFTLSPGSAVLISVGSIYD